MSTVATATVIDHASLTVPDLDAAVAFFVEVLGAREHYRRRVEPGKARDVMASRFNAHPDAGFELARLDVAGFGLELWRYTAPDLATTRPRNCDPGGSHLGFLVPDLAAACAAAERHPGSRVLGPPSRLDPPHPLAGRTWVYLLTPWGQQLELVCDRDREPHPAGLAAEPTRPATHKEEPTA